VEAADISNHASGIVVGKLGTATVTPAELITSFETHKRADLNTDAKSPAVFLDRDGTLMEEVGYCSDPKMYAFFPASVTHCAC